jgi:uncharacterized protein YecE (DUF72 family)
MKLYIGCSGFRHEEWENKFYPENLNRDQWLEYYARHFNSVEITDTFYTYPKVRYLQEWIEKTPDDFTFSVSAHRFFSYLKKLNPDELFLNCLEIFQKTLHTLKPRLGCVLWQLPGNLDKDIKRFETFCNNLDTSISHVVEFRHESWYNESVYDLLRQHDISYCIMSAPNGLPENLLATNKTAYLRFHGKSTWYNYLYSREELMEWKDKLGRLNDIDRIFIYFNNDHNAYAIQNAISFKELFSVEYFPQLSS